MGVAMGVEPKKLSAAAIDKLIHYPWPGNIRELDNVMQRAVILSLNGIIDEGDIQFDGELQHMVPAPQRSEPMAEERTQEDIAPVDITQGELNQDMQQQEYLLIQKALSLGSRKAAAVKLAVSERTLRYKIAKLREAGFKID